MGHDVTTRQYGTEAGDYQMVAAWYSEHTGGQQFPEVCLPPHGVVASVDGEAMAALWVYLSYGIGVAHIHWAIGKPGQSIWVLSAAFKAAIQWIEDVCRAHNCYLIFSTVRQDIAKPLSRVGFIPGDEHVFMSKVIV
jgi:hypothetical protein